MIENGECMLDLNGFLLELSGRDLQMHECRLILRIDIVLEEGKGRYGFWKKIDDFCID